MSSAIERPWERPEIIAAVAEAPDLPGEAVELFQRVFAPLAGELYESAAQRKKPAQAA